MLSYSDQKICNDLFNINRSLAGKENRKSLRILKNHIKDLKIKSFNSGEKIGDWIIPNEWNVTSAYIKDENGNTLIDYKNNFLHLASYSSAFKGFVSSKYLKTKIYTSNKLNDAIPYKTFYYSNDWAFCITKDQYKKLFDKKNKKFFVKIDSTFLKGKMNYGELYLKGKTKREIILSTYICHPNLANNELFGQILAIKLINEFKKTNLRYSMRFLFLPETIGSIAYLNKNLGYLKKNFLAGFNLTCVAGPGKLAFLESKNTDSISQIFTERILKKFKYSFKRHSFIDRGSDERQYSWPGNDLDFISLMYSKYSEYKEYHTSKDNLSFISPKNFKRIFKIYLSIINQINKSYFPKTLTFCEPRMDKIIDYNKNFKFIRDVLSFLTYCDGKKDLIFISHKIKCTKAYTKKIFNFCIKKRLII